MNILFWTACYSEYEERIKTLENDNAKLQAEIAKQNTAELALTQVNTDLNNQVSTCAVELAKEKSKVSEMTSRYAAQNIELEYYKDQYTTYAVQHAPMACGGRTKKLEDALQAIQNKAYNISPNNADDRGQEIYDLAAKARNP